VITGLMSSHFELQNVALDWWKTQKVPDVQAALYGRSFFAGLGAIGLAAGRAGQSIDVADYEIRGGLNEACRIRPSGAGWFGQINEALWAIQARGDALFEATKIG
jgi:hypothetical protein